MKNILFLLLLTTSISAQKIAVKQPLIEYSEQITLNKMQIVNYYKVVNSYTVNYREDIAVKEVPKQTELIEQPIVIGNDGKPVIGKEILIEEKPFEPLTESIVTLTPIDSVECSVKIVSKDGISWIAVENK